MFFEKPAVLWWASEIFSEMSFATEACSVTAVEITSDESLTDSMTSVILSRNERHPW